MSENKLDINSRLTEIFSMPFILKDKRLKKLNIGYPGIGSDLDINGKVDVVEWHEFIKDEQLRIPLLVANRAHLWPKAVPFDIFFEQERTVALLHVFYCSSYVRGCEVYRLPAAFNYLVDYPMDYERFKLLK